MADMNLEMAVTLKDQASAGLKKVADEVEKGAKRATEAAKRGAKEQQDAARQTDVLQSALSGKAENYARRLAQTRQTLGIRSEHQIQREIQRTEAAYNRLARSGRASAMELNRAYAASRQQIAQLNAEMGRMPTSSVVGSRFGGLLSNAGRGVTGLAAGVTAGTMYLREPVRKEMSYDRQLAMVANTAFSDRDVDGRIAGKQELHNAVKKAVETGGGTKEDALASLDTLLASGAVSAETAMNLLPTLQKGAVATGASSEDLARIAISSMQQFGIGEQDIGKVLDMAVAAGQAGNFELADMARWLPQQMAAAKAMGLNGMDGLQTLLVANQQARVTAGSSDEAGNNLVNLLAKISSKETKERFEKVEYTDKNGKKHDGIDLIKSMEGYKSKGQNSLEAFMSIMDDVVGSDEKYKELQKKLASAPTKEREALLNEMTDLVEGTALGKIISDRQALMALLGIRNNVQLGAEVKAQVENSDGAVEKSHQVIKDTNDYKVEDAKNTAEFAQMQGIKGFNNILGSVSETLSEYGKEYPNLTSALAGATTMIGGLGTAAFAAAGSLALLNLGKGGNAVGGAIDVATTVGGNGRVTTGGKWSKALNIGSRALGMASVATMLTGDENPDERRMREYHWDNTKLSDKERYEIASKAVSNGWADDKYLLDIEKFGSDPDEVKRLTAQFKQNKFKLDFKKLDSWFSSDDEKAKMLTSFNQKWHELTPEQQASVSEQRSKFEARQKIKANNILNGVGSWVANDEERAYAKTVLDGKADWQVVQNKFYAGLNNPNLGKSSVLKGNAVSAGDGSLANIDFTPLTQSQAQQMNTFQTTLTADIQSLGQSISAGLLSAIQAQTTTLQNKITVELEGRVVAEQVSEQQYQNFKRGV